MLQQVRPGLAPGASAGNAVDKARGTNQLIGLTNGEFNYV